MKRLALVCLTACGAPPVIAVVERAPSPVVATAGAPDAAIEIVDTSIAAIWDRETPHEPHVQAPLGPAIVETPEPERVALPVARARRPGRRAPCFAHRDVLVGSEVWRDLAQFAISMSSEAPPSGRYGTCTIKDGQLRDAAGALLAELHCGITIYVPGIIDERGFEVGDSTTEIATEFPAEEAICWPDEQSHARCWFFTRDDSDGDEWSRSHYGVDAPIAGDNPLRDDAARALFAARKLSRLTVRMSCH